MEPLTLQTFPRAILHIDGDAFFASCEQAVNPTLKGKPVVTGKERGIASAVSYEAKARGVKRGMTIREIKALCPDAIHLPSDYPYNDTCEHCQNLPLQNGHFAGAGNQGRACLEYPQLLVLQSMLL